MATINAFKPFGGQTKYHCSFWVLCFFSLRNSEKNTTARKKNFNQVLLPLTLLQFCSNFHISIFTTFIKAFWVGSVIF